MQGLTRFLRKISLRTKLVALMAVLMGLGVVATAYTAAVSLKVTLVDQVDTDLKSNASAMSNLIWIVWRDSIDNSAQANRNWASLDLNRFYGTLSDADGDVVHTLPLVEGDEPVLDPVPIEDVVLLEGRPQTAPGTAPGSDGWRVVRAPLASGQGYVTVGLPLEDVEETIKNATVLMISSGMAATLVMSLIAYGVTNRTFRPLVRVERTAAAIAAGDLSRRVEEFPPDTEVGRLSRSLNAMLTHIEHAFRGRAASERKMRRFIQDASHELRTPLVTIQGYSELYRHGGLQDDEQLKSAMSRIEGEAKRMGQLVDDLLTLARLDEHRPLERRPVDLLLLAGDAVEDARVGAPDRSVRLVGIDGGPPRPSPTSGDEAKLRQVVANLMTNALRYTPAGSPLEVAVGVLPVIDGRSDAVLEVRDHGPGISEEDAARVFERFYRADSSRQRETGGTGLGLAIVAAIAAQHDGSVRLTETPGGGATMSIHLPFVAADSPSHAHAADGFSTD
ncbi:HAMP domain-containing sensor histidine kinase [Zafaria sp. J156]|uniref:sensor histidine kinase n=1 Tax=Zafaria sp. J156 TaxID=3116490 RepID=UPI002E7A2E3B|nr:HAMP domain-containing sensor histidine kinase [Zafaria sp. J156]MEE1622264.1 HAMP domain-containing sensor histidine kinase [Zafaria sp. J156]